jgi:hypothetical protein
MIHTTNPIPWRENTPSDGSEGRKSRYLCFSKVTLRVFSHYGPLSRGDYFSICNCKPGLKPVEEGREDEKV